MGMNAGASQRRLPEDLLGTVLGTCALERILGRGGMGVVYLAQQSRPHRQVAVKVLLLSLMPDPERRERFLKRFRREADAVAVLEHPNILPIFEYGEQADLAYLVMPYVGRGTLRDRVERKGPLPLAEAAGFLAQASAALDYAHAHGVIHRDVKPQNMLLYPDKRLVLSDFGIAKVAAQAALDDGEQQAEPLTTLGHVVGTPDYIAPEQALGQPIDARADVYSLGVVLFYMVTGRVPFIGPQPMTVAAKHVSEPPPPPSQFRQDLPAAAEAVILKALAKDPATRYRSAGELSRAFRAALPPLPAPVRSTEQRPPPKVATEPAPPKAPSARKEPQPVVVPAGVQTPGGKGRTSEEKRWLAIGGSLLLIALLAAGAYAALKTIKPLASGTPTPPVTNRPTMKPSPTNTPTLTPTNTATTTPPPLYQADQFLPQQSDLPAETVSTDPLTATTPDQFQQDSQQLGVVRVTDPTQQQYHWKQSLLLEIEHDGNAYLNIGIDQFTSAADAEHYFTDVIQHLTQVEQGQIGQAEVEGLCCDNSNNSEYNLFFRDQNVTVLVLVEVQTTDQAIQDARGVAMKMDQRAHQSSSAGQADLLPFSRQDWRLAAESLRQA